MANKSVLESRLRKQLSRLLTKPGEMSAAVAVLRDWEKRGMGPILFGGVVRDLVVLGRKHYPRDVDVVLQHGTMENVVNDFKEYQYRFNRFGGIHLSINRWAFDVWSLEKTWAFTQDRTIDPSSDNLPKTTFLDVEAIAVTFNGPDRIGRIISNGFFEAVEKRCIGINFRNNPFPALSAIRTLITACKLQFAIHINLVRYFINAVKEFGIEELIRAQEHHYSKVIFRHSEIEYLVDYFSHEIQTSAQEEIQLPDKYQPKQLQFWL